MSDIAPALFLDRQDPPRLGLIRLSAVNLLVATAYVSTGYAGLLLAFVGKTVTLFWAPSGLAFAALWLGGRRLAPGIALGAFTVNLVMGMIAPAAAVVACGNTLSAVAAVAVLRHVLPLRSGGELRRVVLFLLLAVLGGTTISATVGTAVLRMLGADSPLRWTWPIWWLGDAMGMLVAAPPILLWRRIAASRLRGRDPIDAVAIATAGAGIIAALALIRAPIWAVELSKLATLLLSLGAAARFGLVGPAWVTLLMAVGAIGLTASGTGPFAQGTFQDSFAQVHAYLFAEALAGMLLAATLADLRRALSTVEAVSESRIRLLNMVGHDVRTPLAGMVAALQALRNPVAPDERERLADAGLGAGAAITRFAADILHAAGPDPGRVTLDLALFDPRDSLAAMLAFHREAALTNGVTVSLQVDPAVPEALIGDRVRIEQLLGNLVGNAVRFARGGDVAVSARWAGGLGVDVVDTGPGVDPAIAPRMFEAFVQGRGDPAGGLGLGLFICRNLVEVMGGTIRYAREPTGGSRFSVTLPLTPARSVAVPLAPEDAAEPPLAVLLVEDDVIARETTAAMLGARGHVVAVAPDAAVALDLLASGGVDLVLLDMNLAAGQLSGLDLTRAIRALPPPVGAVSVVALTGAVDRASRDEMIDAGVDGILHKPMPIAARLHDLVVAARATLGTAG